MITTLKLLGKQLLLTRFKRARVVGMLPARLIYQRRVDPCCRAEFGGNVQEPIFKSLFGPAWHTLPPVMRKHYDLRPYTRDNVLVKGKLDVMCAGPVKFLAPFFWLMNTIPPHNENSVSVAVLFHSSEQSKSFHFNRGFAFESRKPYVFHSRMVKVSHTDIVELMRFGVGWRAEFLWRNGKVVLKHKGYVLAIAGLMIPLPLTALLGVGHAEEQPISDDAYDMFVRINHPRWGKTFECKGRFMVVDRT